MNHHLQPTNTRPLRQQMIHRKQMWATRPRTPTWHHDKPRLLRAKPSKPPNRPNRTRILVRLPRQSSDGALEASLAWTKTWPGSWGPTRAPRLSYVAYQMLSDMGGTANLNLVNSRDARVIRGAPASQLVRRPPPLGGHEAPPLKTLPMVIRATLVTQ